jgi:hypothetical protein
MTPSPSQKAQVSELRDARDEQGDAQDFAITWSFTPYYIFKSIKFCVFS